MRRSAPAVDRRRQDREDRPDRDVGVDVGGAIERIERHDQRCALVADDGLSQLLGGDRGDRRGPECGNEERIGANVEILLDVSMDVGPDLLFEGSGERTPCDQVGNLPCRMRERQHGRRDRPAIRAARAQSSKIGLQRNLLTHGVLHSDPVPPLSC